jgi:hypothetical protein
MESPNGAAAAVSAITAKAKLAGSKLWQRGTSLTCRGLTDVVEDQFQGFFERLVDLQHHIPERHDSEWCSLRRVGQYHILKLWQRGASLPIYLSYGRGVRMNLDLDAPFGQGTAQQSYQLPLLLADRVGTADAHVSILKACRKRDSKAVATNMEPRD